MACSDGGGGASLAALGVDDGASAGLSKSADVTSDEPVRIALETGALVEIPAGAVTKTIKVSVERPADDKALEMVNRLPKSAERIASAPYVLTPHGTKFKDDVTVKLPLSKKGVDDVSVAWLEDEDDKQWKFLAPAQVDGDTATVKLKHFSVVMLVDDASDLVPLDGGNISEDEDAGDVADADGTDVEDTGTPDELDAGEEEVDADLDELDAGSDESDADAEIDAGSAAADTGSADAAGDAGSDELDATVAPDSDASAPTDADTDAGDAQPDATGPDAQVAATLRARLTECGLVIDGGTLAEPASPWPYERCRDRCALAGTCGDVEDFYCLGGDVTFSTETQACINGCIPGFFVCPDQTQGEFHCDGLLDCPGGEDEADCDPTYFQCGSQRLPAYARCDRSVDCAEGEDEQGCVWHQCDGDVFLSLDHVCDGFMHCVDGSDEPASCAAVACSFPAAQ